MNIRLRGLVAAPFTPMHPDGEINLEAIGPYAEMLHAKGVTGAFVCGTTGESLSLTREERMEIAAEWVRCAPEGLKVIIHVGHNCLKTCQTLSAHAQKIGADAIGSMPPGFLKPPTIEDLIHFTAQTAAAAPDLPYYYYHMPSMTHVDFPMSKYLEHACDRIPTLNGIKFTHNDLADFQRCLAFDNGRFDMLFGWDESLLAALALGAKGAVGSTYNFAAPLYLRLIKAFNTGDFETARVLQLKSVQIVDICLSHATPIMPATKAIIGMLGIDLGPCRPPLPQLASSDGISLRADLDALGFFKDCT